MQPLQSHVRDQRLAGYQQGLHTASQPVTITNIETHSDTASGFLATQQLLAQSVHNRPTAILAMSDAIAFGAMQACEDIGLQIPRDISVIGFDNIAESAAASLTTVNQPIIEKAILAVEILIEAKSALEPLAHRREVLETQLIVRGSTSTPAFASTGC